MVKRNKACPCCKCLFVSNSDVVKHMKKNEQCQTFILRCPGCKDREFANESHLQNHFRQCQNKSVWCYDPNTKHDLVSTLKLSNLQSTSSLLGDGHVNKTGNGNQHPPSSSDSSLKIAIEQVQPKQPHSTASVYGLKNITHSTKDTSNNSEFYSLFKKKSQSLFPQEDETNNSIRSRKRGKFDLQEHKLQPSQNGTHKYLYATNNDKSAFLTSDSIDPFKMYIDEQKCEVISQQFQILDKIKNTTESNSNDRVRNRHQQLFNANISNGDSYTVAPNTKFDNPDTNDDIDYAGGYDEITDDVIHNYLSSYTTSNVTGSHQSTLDQSMNTSQSCSNNEHLTANVDVSLHDDHNGDSSSIEESIVNDDLEYLSEFCYFADEDNDDNFIPLDEGIVTDDGTDTSVEIGIHSRYIADRCRETSTHRSGILWNDMDFPLIDLYHMHKKCRAPISLFDETIKWLENHWEVLFDHDKKTLTNIPKRHTFIKNMYEKVYGSKNVEKVKPKLIKVNIPQFSTSINATLFDFREVMVDMLSNSDIMNPEHLLFYDDNDPTQIHPVGSPFSNVISSDVFRRAHRRLCSNPNDVLWPLVVYNDEINFDSHGKLKLDPLQLSFLRLPQHIRNQPFAWRTFGIVHNLESRMFSKSLSSSDKLQVQHKVLSELYKMVELLQQEGGIPWNLKMKDNSVRKVNLKIYIQIIIGDTKGHDQHCGRMGSHSTGMSQCVRDCNVSMQECDNVEHVCTFRKKSDFDGLDKDGCNNLSFHKIDNCYDNLDLGDDIHGIFGATPGEPLHILDSGLCPMISDVFKSDLSGKCFDALQQAVMNIVSVVERQSASKFMPSIKAFRNGLVKINCLTGKEKSSRLFAMFLALMCSDACEVLSTSKEKGVGNNNIYGEDRVEQWLQLLEDTLCFRQWLKEEVIPATHLYSDEWRLEWEQCFNNNNDGDDLNDLPTEDDNMVEGSIAQNRVIQFLRKYYTLISIREGNGLKIPKFHLCFHFCRNICRHGPVSTYDGARPEANAKELAKCPGLRTQKHHKSISYQTACRYHEDLTIMECERLLRQKCKILDGSEYSYFNKEKEKKDKIMPPIQIPSDNATTIFDSTGSSRFTMKFIPNRIQRGPNAIHNLYTYKIEWENKHSNISERINDQMLQCLAHWLWIDPRGGRITKDSICKGFTQATNNGVTYRCHPSYRSEQSWYDWAYIKWDGYDDAIPARLYMFFELSECDFETENDLRIEAGITPLQSLLPNQSASTLNTPFVDDDYIQSSTYWAIVHSATSAKLEPIQYPSSFHLKSKIATRIKMERNQFRIVPIDSIVGPCFGMLNYSLSKTNYDNTAIIVDPPHTWPEKFITSNT